MKKIAFCFLIYDIINLESLWYIYFKQINQNKYTIYIHYKVDVPLKYFNKYKLTNCIETKHGDISLVKAQNILLEEAIKDKDNQHFILLSNSCIPFKSFNYIYNKLNYNYSYFNFRPPFIIGRHINVTKIDKKFIYKTDQWCILNRKHTNLMLKKDDYLNWFENTFAPDEHCYITNIYYNNLENEIISTKYSSENATTFTNWGRFYSNYKYKNRNFDLKYYNYISKEELNYLLNSACLFGRKFMKESLNSLFKKEYIMKITNN